MLRSIPQRVDVYKRHDTYNDVRTLSTTAQFSSLTAGEVNKVLSGNITGGVTNSYPHAGEYIYEVVEVKPSDQASPGTDTEGMAYSEQKYQMRVWVKNVNASGNLSLIHISPWTPTSRATSRATNRSW